MTKTRIRYLLQILFAFAITAIGVFQMFARTEGRPPATALVLMGVIAVLFIVTWALICKFQPYANQSIMACVLMLTSIGILMIARCDAAMGTSVATRQMIWLCLALVCCDLLFVFMRDYRVLRRFSYVSMVIGLVLLLSPMIPGLGREIGGARIWIGIGPYSLQPGEFAKLFLAFFFASYLFNHRDQLAVGGKKLGPLQLPRFKDLGPIVIVWIASMGVLILQHDLGTSLMFFAMFVAMLYVATGRVSWIIIGFLAFAAGSVVAAHIFAHVGYRVDAWLHPFDPAIYSRYPGGSSQIVQGLFGLASGGLMGTGLGQGYPTVTPLANSDFIYASTGEELGLVGVFAVLMLYLLIIAAGMIIAMKIKDGFGKLLSSGLVFTMAFQVFTVVGGITLVIPLTGLTMPYMAAGGSSLIANYLLAALLIIISNAANKPQSDELSDTFRMEALSVLRSRQRAEASSAANDAAASSSTAANDAAASSSTAANDGDGPITQIVTPINTHSYVNLPQRAVDDAHPGGEA
ncbi:MAG: FtsW/RodA/SpoVE family cell cycle protein [Bifidobacterium choerinum]